METICKGKRWKVAMGKVQTLFPNPPIEWVAVVIECLTYSDSRYKIESFNQNWENSECFDQHKVIQSWQDGFHDQYRQHDMHSLEKQTVVSLLIHNIKFYNKKCPRNLCFVTTTFSFVSVCVSIFLSLMAGGSLSLVWQIFYLRTLHIFAADGQTLKYGIQDENLRDALQ